MSGFIVAHRSIAGNALTAVCKQQINAGFKVIFQQTSANWQIIGFTPLLEHMPDSLHQEEDGSFAYCSGTFFYSEAIGKEALKAAIAAWKSDRFQSNEASGHFALLIGNKHNCQLYRDALPSNRIYHNASYSCFSNLFMPMCQLESSLSIDPQGLYEYAWLHANHGQHTPFREISTLGASQSLRFSDDNHQAKILSLPMADWALPDQSNRHEEDIVNHYADALKQTLKPTINAFGSRIKTALSGGYDSRLIAAGLINGGSDAKYYVYGAPSSADRVVASEIADRLKLDFSAIEKPANEQLSPQDYIEHIDRKAIVFDGLYVDGLFDNAVDMQDRMTRLQDTDILLIGSGGEALRNFFYLPNGRYTADQLVSSFYSTYDPAACSNAFVEKDFRQQLCKQLAQDIRVDAEEAMSRDKAELAYPLFRVRYWSTREIAVNQRYGWTLYPYLHPEMIKGTASIPLKWKNHGRLEGQIIKALSPELAAINSDYGFSFDQAIPLGYRAKMQATYLRPPWLRRYSYRLQMRAKQTPTWPDAQTLSHWMNPALPQMAEYFYIDKIKDSAVLNRLATVEYLLNKHAEFRQQLTG